MIQKIIQILSKRTNVSIVFTLAMSFFLISCSQGGGSGSIGSDGTFSADVPKAVQENTTGLELTAKLIIDEGTDDVRTVNLTVAGGQVTGTVGGLSLGEHSFTIQYFLGTELFASASTIVNVDAGTQEIAFPIDGLNTSPTATVRFPTKKSLTNSQTLTITGAASDSEGIANIQVNGVDATSTDGTEDGFTTWTVKVPLSPGQNVINIRTEDNTGHISPKADTVTVTQSELLLNPKQIALDLAGNRAFVIDEALNALLEIDLSSGIRTIISGEAKGEGNMFITPSGLALDLAANRALVIDSGSLALIAVDLASGDRQLVSGSGIGGSPTFTFPVNVAIASNRAIVVDAGQKALISVDLSTGDRSFFSGGGQGLGTDFVNPSGIAMQLDSNGDINNVFVSDIGLKALVKIDEPSTGTRSIVSDAGDVGVPFIRPQGVALDLDNNRVLVVDDDDLTGLDVLVSVDISTGERTPISDGTTGSGPRFINPFSLALDLASSRAFVIDNGLDALFSVDLASGQRTVISDGATGLAADFFGELTDIALAVSGNSVFVTDDGRNGLLSVDLSSGDRTIISDDSRGIGTNGDESNFFSKPSSLALASTGSAYVLDETLNALLEVNLTNGDRTIISDDAIGVGTSFNAPSGIALDSTNNTAFVVHAGLNPILAVDLANGDRSSIPNGIGTSFDTPQDLALDLPNDRAFVIDNGADALISVVLSDGNRSSASNGTGPALLNPLGLELDLNATAPKAYIIDESLKALLAIDLSTGDKSIISDNLDPEIAGGKGVGTQFISPSGIALDTANNRAFVIDTGLNALSLVELGSGDRVIVSR